MIHELQQLLRDVNVSHIEKRVPAIRPGMQIGCGVRFPSYLIIFRSWVNRFL